MKSIPSSQNTALTFLSVLFLLGGSLLMLPYGRLNEFGTVPYFLLGALALCFGFICSWQILTLSPILFWGVAILTRFLLLWQVPGDDIYRYVWEGRVLLSGINPYLHAPDASILEGLRDTVWKAVEYKGVTAIYPPLTEFLFAFFSLLSSTPFFFKIIFAIADLMIVILLVREFGQRKARLYGWNPLVIYCFAGGGHYDSLFILALVIGWLSYRRERIILAALFIGVAIALKWIALPLAGWILWRTLYSKQYRAILPILLALSLPMIGSWVLLSFWTDEWTFQIFPKQFTQYVRSVEFIPAIVGHFWKESLKHNDWFLIPLALFWLVVIIRARSFEKAIEWIFFLLWIFSPMMHAWYFTWIIPFAVLTRNRGSIAISISGFFYFAIHHYFQSPGGQWALPPQIAFLMWSPLILGFLWSMGTPPVKPSLPQKKSEGLNEVS